MVTESEWLDCHIWVNPQEGVRRAVHSHSSEDLSPAAKEDE